MGLAIGNLVLFSVLLTLQWATLTNKMYRRLEESRKQHEDDNNLLEGLYAEDEGRKIQAYQERAEKDASFLHDVVDFSHLVSDSVKKLTAELEMGVDGRGRTRVYDFLERSVIYLEELLSTLYERSIRISIKLAIDDCTFKTYVRGKNNISSRGGQLKCKKKNQKRLKIARRNAGGEHCMQQAARQAVGHHSPKGGDVMPITLTFHLFGITVQIRLTKKSNNRHSGK